MGIVRLLLCGLAALFLSGIAAANNETDDGFVWIDANTRIKVKPVSTVKPATSAGSGATAPSKAPGETLKKTGKKEKPAK